MGWETMPGQGGDQNDRSIWKKSRFLVDENLDPEVASILRDEGWNARHTSELELTGHSDEDVFAVAYRENRIILTNDSDFLDDRRFPPHRNPGIIILPGGGGDVHSLVQALKFMLWHFAPFRDVWLQTKTVINSDLTMIHIRRNLDNGKMERNKIKIQNDQVFRWTE